MNNTLAYDFGRGFALAMDSKFFTDWKEAHTYAVQLARQLGREVGIGKSSEYGKKGFSVYHLPKAENRYGFELGLEVVKPTDPL